MYWLQRHWYRITPLHLALLPISLLFRLLVATRRALYRSHIFPDYKLAVPVIVIGNITVGGTGKTPLTLALAQQLAERGKHPLIVSRGYGGTSSEFPQRVGADSDARQIGDEPLLMARRGICPVWVGKDRVATAQAALQAHPQCDVALCDDGLQHYRLRRDTEIAVLDGTRGFGNGFLLPAGPLREPVSRLQTVDAVVVHGSDADNAAPGQLRASAAQIACLNHFTMQLSGKLFCNLLNPDKTAAAEYFLTTRNHAVAGIGHPQRYFQHLAAMGIPFTPHAFPDHHPYRASDLAFEDCDTILLTEKDAVKCAAFADTRFWVLHVDAQFDPSLTDLILRKITPHGSQTA